MKKVTIGLDRDRELEYNINALCDLEERFDTPAHQLFDKDKVGIKLIRSLVYVGLKHAGMAFDGKTSKECEEEVGIGLQEHWFNKGRTLPELMQIVMEAFTVSGVLTQDKGDNDENPTSQPNPKKAK